MIVSIDRGLRAISSGRWRGIGKTELEWVAVEHHNTEHPHVHIVIRGVRKGGEVLRLSRKVLQHGIGSIAEGRRTHQPGYRTQPDANEAERREVAEKRFTLIDRRLRQDAQAYSPDPGLQYLTISRSPAHAAPRLIVDIQTRRLESRRVTDLVVDIDSIV